MATTRNNPGIHQRPHRFSKESKKFTARVWCRLAAVQVMEIASPHKTTWPPPGHRLAPLSKIREEMMKPAAPGN
jgi:hypothetical protein